jgi:hypothetical protein
VAVDRLSVLVRKRGANIATVRWSVAFYTASPKLRGVKVQLSVPDPKLQRKFERVPIPEGAKPAAGTDEHLVIWQPSSRHLWE